MKYRFTENDMVAGAMALGLISAGIDFDYTKDGAEHKLWAHTARIPDSCEPENWKTAF